MGDRKEYVGGHHVYFDEAKHTFDVDGILFPSVTQILSAVGIAPSVEWLKNDEHFSLLTDYGTQVHNETDTFVRTGENGLSEDFYWWKENVYPLANVWLSEVIIVADTYCGIVDKVGFIIQEGKIVKVRIHDHKTGSSWSRRIVGAQLGMYYKGLLDCHIIPEDVPVEFYCDDLKGSQSRIVEIQPMSFDEITLVIRAYITNSQYEEPCYELTEKEEAKLSQLADAVALAKKAEKDLEAFWSSMEEKMLKGGYRKLETDRFSAYIRNAYEKTSFDSKTFQKDEPELYKKYIKTSTVKSGLVVKVKEETA